MSNKKPTKKKSSRSTKVANTPLVAKTRLANKTFLVIVGVIAVILVVYFGVKGLSAISEKQHLNWASQRLDYVQGQLDGITGTKVSVVRGKACSYGEQANDFDKGKLFCGIVLKGSYVAPTSQDAGVSASKLLGLLASSKVFGDTATGSQIAYGTSYSIPDQGLSCQANINTPNIDSMIPKQQEEPFQVTFNITCKTRASWHYYPTDNNSGV